MTTATQPTVPTVKFVELSAEELDSDAFVNATVFDRPDAQTCTLDEFLTANAEGLPEEDIAILKAMEVDFFTYLGGGAAGFFGILRTA